MQRRPNGIKSPTESVSPEAAGQMVRVQPWFTAQASRSSTKVSETAPEKQKSDSLSIIAFSCFLRKSLTYKAFAVLAWSGIDLLRRPAFHAALQISPLDFLHFLLHQREATPGNSPALSRKPNACACYQHRSPQGSNLGASPEIQREFVATSHQPCLAAAHATRAHQVNHPAPPL